MEGILPIWKEKGMTSHDVVFKVRKILRMKKVGHSGTLDPDVDGVLPICIGPATKVVEYLMDHKKTYHGEVTLGYSTTTEDISGEVVEKTEVNSNITAEQIDQVLKTFEGEIEQTPPMYSAVKVNGKRLYEYARAGKTIERPTRKVNVYSYKRSSEPEYNPETKTVSFRFVAECSKGTYIRTLAVDTGKTLGYPAHMSDLTRVESGSFTREECITLQELEDAVDLGHVQSVLFPIERALQTFHQISISDELWNKVKNGALLPKSVFPNSINEPFLLTYKEKAVAIYATHPKKKELFKPTKILRTSL